MAASIFLFILLVQIGVSYITTQKEVSIAARRNMTIMFFFSVVVCMVAYDIAMMDPSYYDILGVSPSVDDKTLKRAYKTLAKNLHPDKNPNDENAEENFRLMREVYEILSHKDTRETYDAYGQEYMTQARISPRSNSVDLSYERLLMYHAPFYFISALVAYALTISKKSNSARPYALVMLFGMAIIEWYTKTYHDCLWFIPLTIYQQIECLKNIYHYMLQGAIMYAGLVYMDMETMKLALLDSVNKRLKAQEAALQKQEIMLRLLIRKVLNKPADAAAVGSAKNPEEAKALKDAMNVNTLQPSAQQPQNQGQQAAQAVNQATQRQAREHPWGLYIFIGLSLLNYFSK